MLDLLDLLDDEDYDSNRIYTDFNFEVDVENSESLAPVGQSQWGIHEVKPIAQVRWEALIANEVDTMVTQNTQDYYPYMQLADVQVGASSSKEDIRPKLYDPSSRRWMLVDTGAAVSVWPRADYPQSNFDPSLALEAVNKTRIPTFGKMDRQVKMGRKAFKQEFILANVSMPVLGWDFIKAYKLSMVWTDDGEHFQLVDKKANIRTNLRVEQVPKGTLLSLAPIKIESISTGMPCDDEVSVKESQNDLEMPENFKTFQDWSQRQKQKMNEKPEPIPAKYQALVDKFPELQKFDFRKMDVKHGVTHNIDTGSSAPCRAKVRPLLPGSPKAIQGEKNWKELEELGIVEKCDPQKCNFWTSALHLVPKPDGSLRVCGDFRSLNDKTLLDGYPLPSIKNFANKIRGSKIFSRIDLLKAYHQVPLDEASQEKATVITQWGAYKFMRLAMGLRNSAQSFQRLMDHILAGVEKCFVYMDDILVFSENEEEHLQIIETIFKKWEDAAMTISLKKCQFGKDQIDFLGYSVTAEGIQPLKKKIDSIASYPVPKTAEHLLGFLGA